MKSVMMHNFTQVPGPQIERSVFDRSHGYKTCFNSGLLVPVFWDLMVPGDTFKVNMNAFVRLATPIKPIMDNMTITSFFFGVPITQVWDHFKEFMGEQPDPDPDFSNPTYVIPYIQAPDYAAGGIAIGTSYDYLGLPTGPLHASNPGIKFSALFNRSIHRIFNSWFRDENLQDRVTEDHDDGPDAYASYEALLHRGKRKDYFTGALPFPQKGPSVLLPLGDSADIYTEAGNGNDISIYNTTHDVVKMNAATAFLQETATAGNVEYLMKADLSTATAATINDLRQAWQIQKLYEKQARGGTRYYEQVRSLFGITDPGALVLQLPVYLGGSSSPVNIHPIAQTNASPSTPTSTNAQGNLAAFGTASINGHGFNYSATQHMIVIGLIVWV